MRTHHAILLLLAGCMFFCTGCSGSPRYTAASDDGTGTNTTSSGRGIATRRTSEGPGSCYAVGTASYYGKKFHGKKTASGQRFNMHALTAAHPALAFGTRVTVINLANDKSVVVTINDRGPYAKGRIIDLSRAAAARLDMLSSGTARVCVKVLSD